MYRASRRLGVDPKGLLAKIWWYLKGVAQEDYDTLLVFRRDDPHGPHSLLSSRHLVGCFRAPSSRPDSDSRLEFDADAQRRRVEPKPKRPEMVVAVGLPQG